MIGKYYNYDPFQICDICGWKIHNSKMKMTFDHFKTCLKCWYPQPSLLLPIPKFPKENKPVKHDRPDSPNVYIDDTLPPNPGGLS